MKANLNGKTIVIDGVEYRLVAVEADNRNKAIISMETPFGFIQQVLDRDELREGVEEGEVNLDGKHFVIEFCTEDEVKDKVGKSVKEITPVDLMLMQLLEIMNGDDEKDEDE